MKELYVNILDKVDRLRGKLNLLRDIFGVLQDFPNPYTFLLIDYSRLKFVRYSTRVLFFINCYCNEIFKILSLVEEKYQNKVGLRIRIEDDIYFYFDSILTFLKSICEKDSVISIKLIENIAIKDLLQKQLFEWKNEFSHSGLKDSRNEIVHLNHFGMSLDSWCIVLTEQKIKITSGLYDYNGKDLSEMFTQSYYFAFEVIDKITDIYFSEYISKYQLSVDMTHVIIDDRKVFFNDFVQY